MTIEIVDPAWEIAGVIRQLLGQPASNEHTWTVIQRALGATISPSEHYELMSALTSRLLRLDALVRSIRDTELDEQQRARIVQAVASFANVLRPEQQFQTWQHTLQHHLKGDDGLHLAWFSIIAKRYQPLRRVTDDERSKLIAKIEEALKSLETDRDIPQWAKSPLAEGLRRLRFMLMHLLFFGCETAIDQLMSVFNRASAVEEAIVIQGASEGRKGVGLMAVLGLVVLAANVFWLPDQATTAFERYQGWYLKMIVENPKLPRLETRLLPPPASTDQPAAPKTDDVIEVEPPREKANSDPAS
jgi:hypothetical protein